jgi:hypothetical protein
MDEETQSWLLSNVDPNGNPELDPVKFEDPSKEELEDHTDDEEAVEYVEVYEEEGDQFYLEDSWQIEPTVDSSADVQIGSQISTKTLLLALGIFLLVLMPRLFVLFEVTNPQNPGLGWYGDTFHHWQVAYLSKEIGFKQGFLRLWDFKGMEFFWGLLHPLVLSWLFTLTGSVDILIPRLLGVVGASATITMLFFLLRRHFNIHVAIAGTVLAAFNPVALFNDTVGMQEPLGLALFFFGFLLWPRSSGVVGFLWALAGMVRAEYWVFGLGLVVVAFLTDESANRKIGLGIGWAIPSILYAKYMLDYTGNPIYPIYWNFLAGTAGEWMEDIPLNTDKIIVQWAARFVFFGVAALAIWILRKRHKSTLMLLLGVGNAMMIGIVLGFGAYIKGYVTRILFDRLLVVPYMYLGIFIAIGLLYVLPKERPERLSLRVGWIGVVLVLAISQIVWRPIMRTYEPLNKLFAEETKFAEEVAQLYEGGTILIPEDRQALTYALVNYHGITAENLQGQMYDPFAYFGEGDPFENWQQNRGAITDWLRRFDIRLMVFYTGKETYEAMIRLEPAWFRQLATLYWGSVQVYEVLGN